MNKESNFRDLREKLNMKKKVPQTTPTLCTVCGQISFLKCMDCQTIYCSSKCQVEDWIEHQHTHKKPLHQTTSKTSSKTFAKELPESKIQKRIYANQAVDSTTQVKLFENSDRALKEQNMQSGAKMDRVTEVTNQLEYLTFGKPDKNDRKTTIAPSKFRRCVQFDEALSDNEGFSSARVLNHEVKPDGTYVFLVMPSELEESFKQYQFNLQATYDNPKHSLVANDEIESVKKGLVMAKLDGKWYRAVITLQPKDVSVIALRYIDIGKSDICPWPGTALKVALESETMKPAYILSVFFENLEAPDLKIGDQIKMRLTVFKYFDESMAELKLNPDTNDVSQAGQHQESNIITETPVVERYFYEKIEVKELTVGKNIKLIFCDGNNLEKSELSVCESTQEAWDFYEDLASSIEKYVTYFPDAQKYKPSPRELVLVKYSDGLFYRAVAIEAFDTDAKVYFVDYGSMHTARFDSIMKMPESLIASRFSQSLCHSADFRLVSNRSLSLLDIEGTRKVLMDRSEFCADVTNDGARYKLMLEDSLVVFKS